MATAAQIHANQLNARHSTGPTSDVGKQASSRNRTSHGLCQHNSQSFYLLADEDPQKFAELRASLAAEHQPRTETERILVQRLADHEWLRTRALRLQTSCFVENQHVLATKQLALYLRYQTTHERAFYQALEELRTIRAQRIKEQIGFESQKCQQAAEERAAEAHNLKKQAFELKKQRLASPKQPENTKRGRHNGGAGGSARVLSNPSHAQTAPAPPVPAQSG